MKRFVTAAAVAALLAAAPAKATEFKVGLLAIFAGGFVAQLLVGGAGQEALVFGTHGRSVDFYDNPILFGLG